eukprot:4566046-Pyramimonas_sp.AAC.1
MSCFLALILGTLSLQGICEPWMSLAPPFMPRALSLLLVSEGTPPKEGCPHMASRHTQRAQTNPCFHHRMTHRCRGASEEGTASVLEGTTCGLERGSERARFGKGQ